MVDAWVLPDYANQAQVGDTYPKTGDTAIGTLGLIGTQFKPQAQDTPDMTVRVLGGTLTLDSGSIVVKAAQNSGTITAPGGGDSRKDIVQIDGLTGDVGITTGTAGPSPSDPVLPGGKIPIARVNLTSGQASIANGDLDDLRPLWRQSGLAGLQPIDTVSAAGDSALVIDNTLLIEPYRVHELLFDQIVPSAAGIFELRFSFDNGSTWNPAAHEYFPGVDAAGSMASAAASSSNTQIFGSSNFGTVADAAIGGVMTVRGALDDSFRTMISWEMIGRDNGGSPHRYAGNLKVLDTSVVNALELTFAATLISGDVHVSGGV